MDESERAVEQQPRREVVVGDVVELTVSDLPGAGYRWEVPAVPPGLTLVEGEWVQDDPPPPMRTRKSADATLLGTMEWLIHS